MQITIRLEGDGAQKILNFILIWGKNKTEVESVQLGKLRNCLYGQMSPGQMLPGQMSW